MKTALILLLCAPLLGCAQSQFPPVKHRDSVLHYVLKGEWVHLPNPTGQSNRQVVDGFPRMVILKGDTLDRQDWDCETAMPLWNAWSIDKKDKKELLFRTGGTLEMRCPAIRYVRRDDQPIVINRGQWRYMQQRVKRLEDRP